MSNEDRIEYKGIARKELIVPGISLLVALVGFYFSTNSAIATMTEEVSELKSEMRSKANSQDMNETIKNIHEDIRTVQNSNQKILEILLEKDK